VCKLLEKTGWRWDDSIQLDSKYNPQKRFNLWLAEGFCELKVLRDEGDIYFVNLIRSTGQDLKIRRVDGNGSGSCPMTGIATSSVKPWNFATNVLKASELPYRNTHHVL
jgi:hypothetical protein